MSTCGTSGAARRSARVIGLGALVLLQASTIAQATFQQRVDHRIEVRLDDVRHQLHAYQAFDYHNNAPHALDTLWVHLWPNAYSGPGTALCEQLDGHNDFSLHFAPRNMLGGIDSLDFRSNGRPLRWGYHARHTDIGWVAMEQPLEPGTSITITTPFRVQVPSASFSRLGHAGQAYYISQWYPKPAVYDQDGWHAMPYLTQGEFYSEFGSYDVSITLPGNYVVGATGELQDAQEIAFMDSLAAAPPSFTLGNGGDPFPPSSLRTKTIRFVQDGVHDLAWFADKRFLVKKGQVDLPRSGRTIDTWALFTPSNGLLWQEATTYINESVRLYSEWVGDYPYAACTAVDGQLAAGGGMEYPMITLINTPNSAFDLDVVIAHEVGHNWFYGILGSNERDHPWMDEGVNSYYEQRYLETRYPDRRVQDVHGVPCGFLTRHRGLSHRERNELLYAINARRNLDRPLTATSTAFSELDYGTTVYAKGALVMDQVATTMGLERFDSCMQRYFDEWKFRHPGPRDLVRALGEPSYLNDLLGVTKVDVRAAGLRHDTARIAFRGSYFPAPVNTYPRDVATYIDWSPPSDVPLRRVDVPLTSSAKDRYTVDGIGRTLDIDRRNNMQRAQGLFRRTRLPEVKFLAGIERSDRRSIYWTPVIGRNAYDGWMPGLMLHNTTFPSQRLEWAAAPLFGTESGRLAGGARIQWHHDRLRGGPLQNIHVGLSSFRASLWSSGDVEQWYQRLVPSLQLDLRSRSNSVRTNVQARSIWLQHRAVGTEQRPVAINGEWAPVDLTAEDLFHELRVQTVRTNGLHPFNVQLIGLHHQQFTRAALDAQWSAIYDRSKHRISLRAFTGVFLRNNGLTDPAMGWRMHWGSSDLLYDHLYFEREPTGRNRSLQFNKDQGGFKTPTATGTSDSWIAAVNMELDLPIPLPLCFFSSYGMAPYTTIRGQERTEGVIGQWELGLGLRMWRDMVEVWMPLAFSTDIRAEQELRDRSFGDRIRIVFALEKMDPTQAMRKLPN